MPRHSPAAATMCLQIVPEVSVGAGILETDTPAPFPFGLLGTSVLEDLGPGSAEQSRRTIGFVFYGLDASASTLNTLRAAVLKLGSSAVMDSRPVGKGQSF